METYTGKSGTQMLASCAQCAVSEAFNNENEREWGNVRV
jgi:hypothetical protein